MNSISIGLRLGTMLLDHAIICFIGIPLVILFRDATTSDASFLPISPYVMMPLFIIYFCKDCIGGRSPAKRILKLAVIDNTTNTAAASFQSVIRNLFVVIWPVEVIVAWFNQERRIGDRAAGTRLCRYSDSQGVQPLNILQIVSSILLATLVTYLLFELF